MYLKPFLCIFSISIFNLLWDVRVPEMKNVERKKNITEILVHGK